MVTVVGRGLGEGKTTLWTADDLQLLGGPKLFLKEKLQKSPNS
jgi:hypothetical protein